MSCEKMFISIRNETKDKNVKSFAGKKEEKSLFLQFLQISSRLELRGKFLGLLQDLESEILSSHI